MNIFVMTLAGGIGAVITFLLQRYGISAVVASSLVGLGGALIGFLVSDAHLPAVIFAGSFVGMTTLSTGSLPLITISGLGAGFLFSASMNVFPEYGGRLGTIAFIATVAVLLISRLWAKV